MSLLNRLRVPNDRVKDEAYYVLLETHIPFLKAHSETKLIEVTGREGDMYCGDFYGLLDSLSIDKKFHYLIMRMNDLVSSTDYTGERLAFLIPNPKIISAVIATYDSRED